MTNSATSDTSPSQAANLAMSINDIVSELLAINRGIASARCRTLLMLSELERRKAWSELGCRSGVHWLCRKLGLGRRVAIEHMRVALALLRLPQITQVFAAGEISYSKVRAITRIAAPDNEAELIQLARATTAGRLERIVRARRRGLSQTTPPSPYGKLRWRWDDDGYLEVRLKLPAIEGKLLIAELEKLTNRPDPRTAEPGETEAAGQSLDARRAAAFIALLNRNLRENRTRRRPVARRHRPKAEHPPRHDRRRSYRAARSRRTERSRPATLTRESIKAPMPSPRMPQSVGNPSSTRAQHQADLPKDQVTGTGRPGCSPPRACP